jgi:hypothetical protein
MPPPLPSGYVGWILDPLAKKNPVQSNIMELVETASQPGKPAQQQAMADLTMLAFYYLLRVGEYMVNGLRNGTN